MRKGITYLGKYWIRRKRYKRRLENLVWFFDEMEKQIRQNHPDIWRDAVNAGYRNPATVALELYAKGKKLVIR